jgi:hypothetical protein
MSKGERKLVTPGIGGFIQHVCSIDTKGSLVPESLLRDRTTKTPLLEDNNPNDLMDVVIWYI